MLLLLLLLLLAALANILLACSNATAEVESAGDDVDATNAAVAVNGLTLAKSSPLVVLYGLNIDSLK